MVRSFTNSVDTRGEGHVVDLTPSVLELIRRSGVREGTASLFVPGSTAGLTTIEYEPGALADLRRAFERLAPAEGDYEHNARWGDGNGFSHVRSALLRTSLCVPVSGGRLQLGTWQQIVVINFDNRSRDREVVGIVIGDA